MTALRGYFVRFMVWCVSLALIFGLLSLLLPLQLRGMVTILPYLGAMIILLFRFLKTEQRAPLPSESKRFAWGYVLLFWGYNLVGMLLSIAIFARKDPELWTQIGQYFSHSSFLMLVIGMMVLLSIPLYLITWWFYGPQAKRMAAKMFPASKHHSG